jgi:hypothetical protein
MSEFSHKNQCIGTNVISFLVNNCELENIEKKIQNDKEKVTLLFLVCPKNSENM